MSRYIHRNTLLTCRFRLSRFFKAFGKPKFSHYNMGWYNLNVLPDLKLEEVVRLRKPHPCGSYLWKVVRLGADIGLECCQCGHRVLLTRRELARRIKSIVPRGDDESTTP
jgi:hypothetical protein